MIGSKPSPSDVTVVENNKEAVSWVKIKINWVSENILSHISPYVFQLIYLHGLSNSNVYGINYFPNIHSWSKVLDIFHKYEIDISNMLDFSMHLYIWNLT